MLPLTGLLRAGSVLSTNSSFEVVVPIADEISMPLPI
jgi:hypothetical protein